MSSTSESVKEKYNYSYNSINVNHLDIAHNEMKLRVPDKCETVTDVSIANVQLQGPLMNSTVGETFLKIISVACEALVACTEQLNIMDQESENGDCGTNLAHGANTIKNAIQDSTIKGTSPFVTLTQISLIFKKTVGGLQGKLYSEFFDAAAKAFLEYQTTDKITGDMWLKAFVAANKRIADIGQLSIGDRSMIDALLPAQLKLEEALKNEFYPIDAFGAAVKAAEYSAMETIYLQPSLAKKMKKHKAFKYPSPNAHAAGIWMRGAYEGAKLRLITSSETSIN